MKRMEPYLSTAKRSCSGEAQELTAMTKEKPPDYEPPPEVREISNLKHAPEAHALDLGPTQEAEEHSQVDNAEKISADTPVPSSCSFEVGERDSSKETMVKGEDDPQISKVTTPNPVLLK